MTTRVRLRPKQALAVMVLLPLMLVLAGCYAKFDFRIEEHDRISVAMYLEMGKEAAQSFRISSCDDFWELFFLAYGISTEDSAAYVQTVDKSSGSNLICELNSIQSNPISYLDQHPSFSITHEADKYIVTVDRDESLLVEDTPAQREALEKVGGLTMELNFTFPGRIVEATEGRISGNTVSFTDPKSFGRGFRIVAEDTPSALSFLPFSSSGGDLGPTLFLLLVVFFVPAFFFFVLNRDLRRRVLAFLRGPAPQNALMGATPSRFSPADVPRHFPASAMPGHFPPPGQPGRTPASGRPHHFSAPGPPGQPPPSGRPGQPPFPYRSGQYPPPGHPGQYPPPQQRNQPTPPRSPEHFRPPNQPHRGQVPRSPQQRPIPPPPGQHTPRIPPGQHPAPPPQGRFVPPDQFPPPHQPQQNPPLSPENWPWPPQQQ